MINSSHLVLMLVLGLACGAASGGWSGEAKNNTSQLTAVQQRTFKAKLTTLDDAHLHSIKQAAKPLSVLLDRAAPVNQHSIESAVRQLSTALAELLASDNQMRRLTFMTADYVHPVSVRRTRRGYTTTIDLAAKVEGLRDQIGFFPEGAGTPIDDLEGYPSHQFAVATRGNAELLIRVPLVSYGHYLGDLTVEYSLR